MSWRTIIITERSKIDFQMNYLCVRQQSITTKLFIKEIDSIIFESTAISITTYALNELIKNKVNIIFCDNQHNPSAQLLPIGIAHNCSEAIRKQINWDIEIKKLAWQEIVQEKINNQAKLLEINGFEEHKILLDFAHTTLPDDSTNREGHAAKIYFNLLLGPGYNRKSDIATNAALNYGYALILSTINREISSIGYLTQIGIKHNNIYNPYNLSSDLIEPIRLIIDHEVFEANFNKFEKEEKLIMCQLLQRKVHYNGQKQLLTNAIRLYVRNVINRIENIIKEVEFIKYEL